MPFYFVGRLRRLFVFILLACGPVQCFIDDSLANITCAIIAIVASVITFLYIFNIKRFRRTPLSCVMILGFNVSAFSAAILIQTICRLAFGPFRSYWRPSFSLSQFTFSTREVKF